MALVVTVTWPARATGWGEFKEQGCVELLPGGIVRLFKMRDRRLGDLIAESTTERLSGVNDSTRYFFLRTGTDSPGRDHGAPRFELSAVSGGYPKCTMCHVRVMVVIAVVVCAYVDEGDTDLGLAIAFYSKADMENFMIATNDLLQGRPKTEREPSRLPLVPERAAMEVDLAAAAVAPRKPKYEEKEEKENEEWEGDSSPSSSAVFFSPEPKGMIGKLEELKSKKPKGKVKRKGYTQEVVIKRLSGSNPPACVASSDTAIATKSQMRKPGEVAQFLRQRCALLSGDPEAMEKIIASVQGYGVDTIADIGKRIIDDTMLVTFTQESPALCAKHIMGLTMHMYWLPGALPSSTCFDHHVARRLL